MDSAVLEQWFSTGGSFAPRKHLTTSGVIFVFHTQNVLPVEWVEDKYAILTSCKSESEVTQSCPTLCDPMDCSLLDSSVHGIFQARILEWVPSSFSRGSSKPRDQT